MLSSQQEIELRTDGIVVPRLEPFDVTNPLKGHLIFENEEYNVLMYYNGSNWERLFTPVFEDLNGLIRQTSENGDLNQSFIFGAQFIPTSLNFFNDTLFFFDRSSGAFGGGIFQDGGGSQIRGESQHNFKSSNSVFGTGSFSYGRNAIATGDYSFAAGTNNTASGYGSAVLGSSNYATASYSIAFGNSNTASGTVSTVFGNSNTASGTHSTAFGTSNEASGNRSTAFGLQTEASAANATSFGNNSKALGESSVAIGHYSEAFGFSSLALGENAEAKGNLTNAFGQSVIANSQNSTVVGLLNDTLVTLNSDAMDRPLFVVGNGSATIDQGSFVIARKNAFVVRNNGEVEFDNYKFPINDGNVNQVLSTNGNGQLEWTNNDNSPSNEIQSLSFSNNLLSISSGGSVDLSSLKDWRTSTNDGNSIYFNEGLGGQLGNVGIGTINPDARLEVYSINSSEVNPTLELNEDKSNEFAHQAFSNRFANEKWFLKAKPKNTNSASSASFKFFYTEGDKNIISLKGDGSVGIGMDNTFDNTFASARLEVQANSARGYATLQLHETANDFVRQSFSNTGSNEKWFFTVDPNNDPSLGVFNIYHTDGTGGTNALKLFGDGDAIIAKDLTVTGTYNPSDIRYKKDITSLGGTLSSISKLGGYRYNWKDKNKPEPQIGLIAQEVQAVYPELVKENEDGMLSVSYTKMVPVLLEAIKEQQELIESLEERLEKLEKE